MSKTKIEWTDDSWNPITGCSRVSEGCRNCYAETMAGRLVSMGQEKYAGSTVTTSNGPRWTGLTRFHPDVLAQPLRWRKPRRVFVCSMSDLFHEDTSFEEIAAVYGVMAATPHITYQVLTKRPERAVEWYEWVADAYPRDGGGEGPLRTLWEQLCELPAPFAKDWFPDVGCAWPLPNVHLGTSVEDQPTADERIPLLLECPAAVRWVSYEPALGPVDFEVWTEIYCCSGRECGCYGYPINGPGPYLDWIVAGGESGPGARSYDPAWFRDARDQCRAAGVPYFQKQLTTPGGKKIPFDEWPEDLRVRELPTSAVVEVSP